jgi:23S rRNA (cytidine1920-2'-O)/16S rRNA (cytidine1409-2'-O)-methyltransferase
LDLLLVERGLATTREQARALIMAGATRVGGELVDKPGTNVPEDAAISVAAPPKYVGRGGLKLERALDAFQLDVAGKVAMDVGASTGGFTDCMLQRGAERVYAIDVGYGQLDWKLRSDPRVVVMERTNARYLTSLPEPVDLATMDVSFISVRLVLPAVGRLLGPGGQIIILVKPQFEAGRGQVGKGGVVRDPAIHRSVLEELASWGDREGFGFQKLAVSPVKGPAGNVEFLALIEPGKSASADIAEQVDKVLAEAAGLSQHGQASPEEGPRETVE